MVEQNGIPETGNEQFWQGLSSKSGYIQQEFIQASDFLSLALGESEYGVAIHKSLEKKDEIESDLGFKLDWRRLNNSKASRIVTFIKGLNFDNHSNYNELMNKTIDLAALMRDTFKKYI